MEKELKVIPIFRIFDIPKAMEFYVDWLGFKVDLEHRFGEKSPVYMGVSYRHITIHLTEHHGDACPGSKAFVEFSNLREYHKLN